MFRHIITSSLRIKNSEEVLCLLKLEIFSSFSPNFVNLEPNAQRCPIASERIIATQAFKQWRSNHPRCCSVGETMLRRCWQAY